MVYADCETALIFFPVAKRSDGSTGT